jgi:hypothetical protein
MFFGQTLDQNAPKFSVIANRVMNVIFHESKKLFENFKNKSKFGDLFRNYFQN